MARDKAFLGVGWAFPPAFDSRDRGAAMVAADEDIRQSLMILMGTSPGERIMQPTYGCDLRHLLFEVINQSTITDVKDVISRAVLLFEPRIVLDFITVEMGPEHGAGDLFIPDGVLRIKLDYTVITTNTRGNLVYDFYLTQATSTGGRA